MFCDHGQAGEALVSWNVRTMPRRASLCGDVPATGAPSNVHCPWSASSKPVSRLKNVVLPAPFGPDQGGDLVALHLDVVDVDGDETAERPADRCRRRGSGRPWRRPAALSGTLPVAVGTSSADIEDLLPAVAEDALRPEHDEQRRATTPATMNLTWLKLFVSTSQSGSLSLRVAWLSKLSTNWITKKKMIVPTIGPFTRPSPPRMMIVKAKNVRLVANWPGCRRLRLGGEHQPADRADQAAEDQALHLEGDDVLAERPGGVLVLADALQHATPRAAHQRPDEQARSTATSDQPSDHHEQSVAVERLRAELEPVVVDPRVEVLEEARSSPVLPSRPTGEPREPRRVEEVADDLGGGDRDDRQVVGAQAQRREAEQRGRGRSTRRTRAAAPHTTASRTRRSGWRRRRRRRRRTRPGRS